MMTICVPSYSQNDWTASAVDPASVPRIDNPLAVPVQARPRSTMGGERLAPIAPRKGVVARVVDAEGKQLVDACTAGDPAARQRFHTEFLPLIYRFERKGTEHEAASQNFLTFLFDNDRLYRRLQSYRGAAPLRAYLWACVLPDLMKQFRVLIRRQRLETVSIDDGPVQVGAHQPDGAVHSAVAEHDGWLLDRLSPEKRLLVKLLYIEDFDPDAAELQLLAASTGREVREVIGRLEVARAAVRSREAKQKACLDGAESAGQWIRLYERQLVRMDEDLAVAPAGGPRAARLQAERAALLRKLDKRRRQQAERLRAGSNTVVTLPTAMVAELLGQLESTTRARITRLREELAGIARGTTQPGGEA